MTRRLLLVDVNNQCYKAAATNSALYTKAGIFTGGLYGFMMAVAKAINETAATDVVLCDDSQPYVRSEEYPEYKAQRDEKKDCDLLKLKLATYMQVKALSDVLGWPFWIEEGYECDDLIAFAAKNGRHRFSRIFAMSNDSDLYQLFEYSNFAVYRGKKGFYTKEDFDEEYGMSPSEFTLFLSLCGTHNEVAGIRGVGPVTATKLVRNGIPFEMAVAERSVISRNMGLIKLPHHTFPESVRMPFMSSTVGYDERSLQRFCSMFEIRLQRWQSEAFEQVSKGDGK